MGSDLLHPKVWDGSDAKFMVIGAKVVAVRANGTER